MCAHLDGCPACHADHAGLRNLVAKGEPRAAAKGPWALAGLGDRRSALAALSPAGTLILVDNRTGRRRVVRRTPRNCVDLELSPEQTRVAETVSGRPTTQALVLDLGRRRSLRRRVDGYDLVWYRRDRLAAVASDNHARVYDARLRRPSRRILVRDGGTFAAAGDLRWVRDGELHRRGADGYPKKLAIPARGPLIPIPPG